MHSKPHYPLLDGLRGVAALLVLWHHVFEGYDFAGGVGFAQFYHGYLAVDFFFILSGFVIGYAYDDRWERGFTLGQFVRRRLTRLHPMVVAGAVLGVATFVIGGCLTWSGERVGAEAVMLALLCMLFFIPATPGCTWEVRGNGEMFPLNGPCWSLFYEYIGNIVYALLLRRLSTRALALAAAAGGAVLAWVAVTDPTGYGCLGVGWTVDAANCLGGTVRMLFPYTLGLLLSRLFATPEGLRRGLRPLPVRGTFWWATAALTALFAVPAIPGGMSVGGTLYIYNGMYEMMCIALVFPLVVWLAASGAATDRVSARVCHFLGDISYPVYVVQYPLMYLFYQWLIDTRQYTLAETWPEAVATCAASIALAWLLQRYYEKPVRGWLSRKTIS